MLRRHWIKMVTIKKTKAELLQEMERLQSEIDKINRSYKSMERRHSNIQNALQESEKQYRAIVEDQTDLICRFRPDGTMTFVNKAFCRYFDKKSDAILGHKFTELISKEETQEIHRCLDQLGHPQPITTFECHFDHLDVDSQWQFWTVRALFAEDKTIVEYQAIGRDIADKKRTEIELAKSKQMLELILNNIPQRVFWKDRNYNYLGGNKAYSKDTGCDNPDQIIGKNDFDFSEKKIAELYRADDEVVMTTDTPKFNFEESMRLSDGSYIWLRTSPLCLY